MESPNPDYVPRNIIGYEGPENAAKEHPRHLAPGDDRRQRLGVRQPDEHVARIHGSEDQRVHIPAPPRFRVRNRANECEVNLALHPGLPDSDAHRRRQQLSTRPGPSHPGTDLFLVVDQRLPRRPVPVRTDRAHRGDHRTDKLVRDGRGACIADQARRLGRLHVPACRFPLDPGTLADGAQPRTIEPRPKNFPNRNHADLPENHSR